MIANTYAGRWQEAEPHLRIAVELNRTLYGASHPNVATCLSLLGRSLTFQDKPESIEIQREALAIRSRHYPSSDEQVAWSKTCLAFALWDGIPTDWTIPDRVSPDAVARWAEAEALPRESLSILRPMREQAPIRLAIALHTLGAMLADKFTPGGEAIAIFEEAIELYRAHPESEDRYLAACLRAYAVTLGRVGRYEEEEANLLEFVRLTPKRFRRDSAGPLDAVWRLATLVHRREKSTRDTSADGNFVDSSVLYPQAVIAEFEFWTREMGKTEEWRRLSTTTQLDAFAKLLAPAVRALTGRLDENRAAGMLRTVARLSRFADLLIDSGIRADAAALAESLNGFMGDPQSSHLAAFPVAAGRLGDCFVRLGRYEEAEKLLLVGRRAVFGTRPIAPKAQKLATMRLVRLYDAWKKPREASALRILLDQNSKNTALSPL